jgi:O-antigen/teichoic acid export membrane protein
MTTSRTVARNAVLQGGAEVVGKVLSLALFAVMARELGEDGFGEFAFAFSLASLLIAISNPGTDSIVTREIARDRSVLPRMLWNALGIKGALGLLATALAVLIALAGGYGGEVQLAAGLLGLTMVAEVLQKALSATFLGLDDLGPTAQALVVQRLVTSVLAIAALVAGAGIVAVSGLFLAGAVIGLLWIALALERRIGRPAAAFTAGGARELFMVALPLGLSAVFTVVLFRIDTVLLAWLTDAATVGLYSAAYRLLDATLFISYALVAALFPVLSRLGRTTTPTVGEATTAAAKVLVAVLVPVAATFALFAEPIVRLLYGDAFAAAAAALRWLSGTIALFGLSYLGTVLMASQDRQGWVPWVTGACAVENVVLNLVLIPRFSLEGAAAATTITELTRCLVVAALTTSVVGALDARRIAAGPLLGLGAMVATRVAAGDGWAVLAVAGAAYVVVLVLAERRLFPLDVRLAREAVVRRRPSAAPG